MKAPLEAKLHALGHYKLSRKAIENVRLRNELQATYETIALERGNVQIARQEIHRLVVLLQQKDEEIARLRLAELRARSSKENGLLRGQYS